MPGLVPIQFGSVAVATQLRNRGADRGPQAGSPLGVVDATGSNKRHHELKDEPRNYGTEEPTGVRSSVLMLIA
jgi:hypothetical protein